MQRRSYVWSLVLHIALLSLMLTDVPLLSWQEYKSPPPALLMVDLTKVQIGDKTNLPPEVKKGRQKPASVQSVQQTAVAPPPPAPPKPQEVRPIKNAAPVVSGSKQEKPVKKETKTGQSPSADNKKSTGNLKSLLASVEKIRQPVQSGPYSPAAATGQEVSSGIAGGTGGSLTQALTVSEQDFIATKLRGCWNVDAGAAGTEDVVIEVRASVSKDGRIRDVAVTNAKNTPAFRALAESAVRAVRICDNAGDESPFQVLARRYPDGYDSWKDLFLRFNPKDGSVM